MKVSYKDAKELFNSMMRGSKPQQTKPSISNNRYSIKDLTYEHDYKIYEHYFGGDGEIPINTSIISPIPSSIRGSEDNSPSFWLYEYEKKGFSNPVPHLRWCDAVMGTGSSIDFIMMMEGLDFYPALSFAFQKILTSRSSKKVVRKKTLSSTKYSPILKYTQDFTESELHYWKSRYLIEREQLILDDIYSGSNIKWSTKFIEQTLDKDPLFLYFYDGFDIFKSYRPLTKNRDNKWRSWRISKRKLMDGFENLDSDLNFIMMKTSKKDKMVSNKLFGKYCSVSQLAESSIRDIINTLPLLYQKTDRVIYAHDGDDAGIRNAKKVKQFDDKVEILSLNFPNGTKDDGEVVENLGYEILYKLYKSKL